MDHGDSIFGGGEAPTLILRTPEAPTIFQNDVESLEEIPETGPANQLDAIATGSKLPETGPANQLDALERSTSILAISGTTNRISIFGSSDDVSVSKQIDIVPSSELMEVVPILESTNDISTSDPNNDTSISDPTNDVSMEDDTALPLGDSRSREHSFRESPFTQRRESTFGPSEVPESPTQRRCSTFEPSEMPESYPKAHYEFRTEARQGMAHQTTWLDADNSGDYDPSLESKRIPPVPVKPKKRAILEQVDHAMTKESNRSLKRPKVFTLQHARRSGESFIVTLSLPSDEGRALLATLPDNWPEEDYNYFDESQPASDHGGEGSSTNIPKLRSMRRLRIVEGDVPKGQEESRIPDPLGVEPDLNNHPIARGCVQCRIAGFECALIHKSTIWPCGDCIEADVECELFYQPEKKGSCTLCSKRRIDCSYLEENTDHNEPCEHCAERGFKCVAGPASGTVRHQLTYTRIDQIVNPETRLFIKCTACRAEKKICSLKKITDCPPCKGCKEGGILCTFEKLPRTKKAKKGKRKISICATEPPAPSDGEDDDEDVKAQVSQIIRDYGQEFYGAYSTDNEKIRKDEHNSHHAHGTAPPDSDDEDILVKIARLRALKIRPKTLPQRQYVTDSDGHGGYATTIRTAFRHPILFNYQGRLPCHFCESPTYGVFGLGPAEESDVIEWDDGLGYTEYLLSPYCGAEQARMCTGCGLSRFRITNCEGHDVQAIEDESLTDIPQEKRFYGMCDRAAKTDRWCVVCCFPALYECVRFQKYDTFGNEFEEGDPEAEGCGMELCQGCAELLVDRCEGSLQQMLQGFKKGDLKMPAAGLRADVEFLEKGSLLERNIMAEFMEEEQEQEQEGQEEEGQEQEE